MATLVALLALAGSVHIKGSSGGAAMFSGLSRLRLLSVLLPLVLVALVVALGGRLADRPAAQVASSPTSGTPSALVTP
jgi:hypothetical protein